VSLRCDDNAKLDPDPQHPLPIATILRRTLSRLDTPVRRTTDALGPYVSPPYCRPCASLPKGFATSGCDRSVPTGRYGEVVERGRDRGQDGAVTRPCGEYEVAFELDIYFVSSSQRFIPRWVIGIGSRWPEVLPTLLKAHLVGDDARATLPGPYHRSGVSADSSAD
jgi:hypothetical protein